MPQSSYSGRMSTNETHPPQRAEMLSLRGPDADNFARTQLASQLDALASDHWQWTSWLDPTGKVRLLGMLWRDGEDIHILLRGGIASQLRNAMQPFVMRSRLELLDSHDRQLAAADALPAQNLERDGKDWIFGMGHYSLRLTQLDLAPRPDSWIEASRQAIHAGHPWLPDSALDTLLPPALALYSLGAVSLEKGCYPGQEMTNRLHRLGGHKYAMAHLDSSQAWAAGESLAIDQRKVGTVLLRVERDVLVVARMNALESLPDTKLIRQFPA